jgi:hypothetical protein
MDFIFVSFFFVFFLSWNTKIKHKTVKMNEKVFRRSVSKQKEITQKGKLFFLSLSFSFSSFFHPSFFLFYVYNKTLFVLCMSSETNMLYSKEKQTQSKFSKLFFFATNNFYCSIDFLFCCVPVVHMMHHHIFSGV